MAREEKQVWEGFSVIVMGFVVIKALVLLLFVVFLFWFVLVFFLGQGCVQSMLDSDADSLHG